MKNLFYKKTILSWLCLGLAFVLFSCAQEKNEQQPQEDKKAQQQPKHEHDLIRVTKPRANSTISSPLKIEGKVRGNWLFEATAPFIIVTENNDTIADWYITAKGDWMTQDLVPFEAEVSFEAPKNISAKIIFKKANPSGLKKHDDEFILPVQF